MSVRTATPIKQIMTTLLAGAKPQTYPISPTGSFSNSNYKSTTLETIRHKMQSVNVLTEDVKPFYVCDLANLDKQLSLWNNELPEIKPMYAIKCNPDLGFVNALIQRGVGFDCASVGEIETVLSSGSSDIIYANPVKSLGQLIKAKEYGVSLTTVDSVEEIEKCFRVYPDVKVLVRITTDDSTSTCPLSVKFGASAQESKEIIDKCIDLGVDIRGVAFHVGSGFKDASTLKKAVDDSRLVWDYAAERGTSFDILDVGGGFSFNENEFVPAAKVLREELYKLFGHEIKSGGIGIIAELGRFLSGSCFTLAVNINGVRKMKDNKTRIYINDGLYGNLNCILYDHQVVSPQVLTANGEWVFNNLKSSSTGVEYSIWGPTCDGLDCVVKSCSLPYDVNMGDWMLIENAGAYTITAATSFNGFTNDFECIYINN